MQSHHRLLDATALAHRNSLPTKSSYFEFTLKTSSLTDWVLHPVQFCQQPLINYWVAWWWGCRINGLRSWWWLHLFSHLSGLYFSIPLLLFFVSPSLQLITLQHSRGFIITYLLSDVARWSQWETEQALCKAVVPFSLEIFQRENHLWLFSLHFQ